jgi:hypothetical protein
MVLREGLQLCYILRKSGDTQFLSSSYAATPSFSGFRRPCLMRCHALRPSRTKRASRFIWSRTEVVMSQELNNNASFPLHV